MGKITGFMEYRREVPKRRPVQERLRDWKEFEGKPSEDTVKTQGARCMDCGIPFCHNGCPLGNLIPDWNDLVYRGRWKEAIEALHATNNFPEFTGRVCPAPCEEACVLNINDDPVAIKLIEKNIIDHAFQAGFVRPQPPLEKTGKRVAVVGSGPAGMAAAQQLARAGHDVTLFERSDRIGGLLRYGIPDFKMEKHLIDRRMDQMRAEGVTFRAGVAVGTDISADDLRKQFDAVVLSIGATQPRDLPVPGRELDGVHFAMDFLPQQNMRVAGDPDEKAGTLKATGKHVVVIGGGDTGSDCIGTSNRQGAQSITQLEILPKPPDTRTQDMPWPYWPMIFRTSSSHEEGVEREFSINTRRFVDKDGRVCAMECVRVEWFTDTDGRRKIREIEGSEFQMPADLVLLAMGFVGPERNPLLDGLGVALDERGNVKADPKWMSSVEGVFSCGDARRGQSLVVWAIWEGRECARAVDAWLMGETKLPSSPQLL
ncbi:MAG TPA: glutamate synthase subunit beta [Candidatus Binatia bacterium]|nr:glutamate synthase subunit beta [Candidatus Binatia bacterium]